VILFLVVVLFLGVVSAQVGGGEEEFSIVEWIKEILGFGENDFTGASEIEPFDWLLIDSKQTQGVGGGNNQFGKDIGLAGDVAISGADLSTLYGSRLGLAVIYRINPTTGLWDEDASFTSSDALSFDFFGRAVDIRGDVAVVGAEGRDDGGIDNSGAAYVFRFNGVDWVEEQKLLPPDPQSFAIFGSSVSVYGDYIAIASERYDNSGAVDTGGVYIYKYNSVSGSWSQDDFLISNSFAANDFFGVDIDMVGDVLAVGINKDDEGPRDSGAVDIYRLNVGVWEFEQKLVASDARAEDWFGSEVSVWGNYILVGAPQDDDFGSKSGAAYVFGYDGNNWIEKQKITVSDGAAADLLGNALSISSNYLFVGVSEKSYFDGATELIDAGAVYIFQYDSISDNWEQVKVLREDVIEGRNRFGIAVAVDGDYAFIGGDQFSTASPIVYTYRYMSLCGDGIQNGDEEGVDCGGELLIKLFTPFKLGRDAKNYFFF